MQMSNMLNVLLVEDHNVVRNGLKLLLETDQTIKIVAEAINGRQALDILAKNNEIDLVLSDINMPEMDGIALINALKETGSTVSVVLLSMLDKETTVNEAFRAGAAGYLLKSSSTDELLFALKHVHSGERYLCATLAIRLLSLNFERGAQSKIPLPLEIELSSREIEILELIAKGLTNQEMSDSLFLSKRTVEGHRQGLLDKFAVRNSAELIYHAMRTGLIR
ncbi:MAG: response regulator transcription factor [Pedobacter sp.]|nr:MAG: response regulator transcription factor [Pedobacter sp.]